MVTPIEINGSTQGFVDSRIGGRNENQDSAGLKKTKLGFLIIVCDGMGGMQGGSVASQLAVQKIMEVVASADVQDEPKMIINKAIRSANMAIIDKGRTNPDLTGMGTTVTVLLITPYAAITAYVGDSRIYQLRGRKKVYRTFDHSMVFEMVKKKIISEEQARLSAQSNVILNALGIRPELTFEVCEHPYQKGDRFILCSDGFWGCMPEEELIMHLSEKKPLNLILESTANLVENIGIKSGSEYDNLTAAIVEMNENSILEEKMNKKAKLIIAVLAVLLVISLAFNYMSFATSPQEDEKMEEPLPVLKDAEITEPEQMDEVVSEPVLKGEKIDKPTASKKELFNMKLEEEKVFFTDSLNLDTVLP